MTGARLAHRKKLVKIKGENTVKKLFAALTALCMLAVFTGGALAGGCSYHDTYGDHNWNQVDVKLPTCTSPGYVVIGCLECGYEYTEQTGDAYGHDWDRTYYVPPTCIYEGYAEYTCLECGEVIYEDFEPVGHVWVEDSVVEGTCSSPTYIHYVCKYDCGDTRTETIEPQGHNWRDTAVLEEATCTSEGVMQIKCRDCGKTDSRDIEKAPHSYGQWQDKLVVDNGMCLRERVCTVCGHSAAEEYYPEGTLYRNIDDVEGVKQLQTMLTDCGYLNDVIDGRFGKKTEQAVIDFQKAAGLNADGVAWPETVSALTGVWYDVTGISPEPAAVPGDNADETARAVCTETENPDGTTAIAYCEAHAFLFEMCDSLYAGSGDRAAEQARLLWQDELDSMYDMWIASAPQEDVPTIVNGRAMFEAYLISQEDTWAVQYPDDPAKVAEMVNELIIDQCISLCPVVYGAADMSVEIPGGNASVSPVDGWHTGAAAAEGGVSLYNDDTGAAEKARLDITDCTSFTGIDQAMQMTAFAYAGAKFEPVDIGGYTYYYIAGDDGIGFTLLISTGAGTVLKIDGTGCALNDALGLIGTIVIN